MLKRISSIILIIIGLCWIIYAGLAVLKPSAGNDYLCFFGKEDSTVLAIHHIDEFGWENTSFSTLGSNKDIYASIVKNLPRNNTVFISQNRPVIVIENKEKWTKYLVNNLMKKGIFPFEMTGLNSFKYGKYIGYYKGKQLLLYNNELTIAALEKQAFKTDHQASFSLVDFRNNKIEISDIYQKDEAQINYKSSAFSIKKKTLVDDREGFSEVTPSVFESYHFYEKTYLAEEDKLFKKSVLAKCISTGMVELRINGGVVYIFDLIDGQSPIQVMNEKMNLNEENGSFAFFKSIALRSENMELRKNGGYISELNGFALISNDKAILDIVLTEIEMGHTLSTNNELFDRFHYYLPINISERFISNSMTYSVSAFNLKRVQTTVKLGAQKSDTSNEEEKDYFTMNPGSNILLFTALAGRGNLVVFTENQALQGYKNGIKKWSHACSSPLKLAPKNLEFSNDESEHIGLLFENNCEIIDKMGRNILNIKGEFDLNPIRIKNKDALQYLLIHNKQLLAFNEKGAKLFTINEKEDIEMYHAFVLKNKVYCAVKTKSKYSIIDIGTKKIIRSTSISLNSTNFNIHENGDLTFIEGNSYYLLQSNGTKKSLSIDAVWELQQSYVEENVLHLLFTNGGQLKLTNNVGKVIWNKSIPVREFSNVSTTKIGNEILITIFDGVENKVLFYTAKGEKLNTNIKHASTEVQVTPFGASGTSTTTLLGNLLIQYNSY